MLKVQFWSQGEGRFTESERNKDRERDLMEVSASADRLPAERLLVTIETPREDIKKGRVGKTCFFMVTSQSLTFCTFSSRKCSNEA